MAAPDTEATAILFAALRRRLAPLLIPTLVLAVLTYEVFNTPIYSESELSDMRERAVAEAAQGEVDDALERLRALSEVAPDNRLVWGDYLVVRIRAGQAEAAIAQALAEPVRALPDYALAALFDAALMHGDLAAAREFARREVAQSPQAAAVEAARQAALAQAIAPLPPITAPLQAETTVASVSEPAPATVLPAVAPASPRSRRPLRQALPLPVAAPVAESAGASTEMVVAVAESPAGARARQAVRVAEAAPPGERVARAQEALTLLADYSAELQRGEAPADIRLHTALDRVRALTLAGDVDAAAREFEALDIDTMPLFGLMHGADLYTRRQQHERASSLLERAASQAPADVGIAQAQFYNALDREQYDEAAEHLQRRRTLSQSTGEQRDGAVLEAMFAAWRNRLDGARQQLDALGAQAPDDAGLALRRAQIYRWRGWPQRALDIYQTVPAGADPVALRLGEAAALDEQKRFAEADARRREATELAPGHPDVRRAQAEAVQRDKAEYSARVLAGESADSPVSGNGDLAIEQQVYSSPLADHYRVFARQRFDQADFPEGTGDALRLAVGGDYRSQYVDARVAVGDRDGQPGVMLGGEWRPDDYWAVFGEWQSDSDAVPLRALHNDIDGESATLGVRYRAHESRELRLGYGYADFSDGNLRQTLSAQLRQALFDDAHHRLAAIAQLYRSDNTAGSDAPYFNPDHDTSLGLSLEYSGILARNRTLSWSQRLVVGAGSYRQAHQGSGGIHDAEYEQRWQLGPTFAIHYGVLYRSRLYDGEREGYTAVFGGVNWRF